MWKQCEQAEQSLADSKQRKNAAKRMRKQRSGNQSINDASDPFLAQLQETCSKGHTVELIGMANVLVEDVLVEIAAKADPERSLKLLQSALACCMPLRDEFRRRCAEHLLPLPIVPVL